MIVLDNVGHIIYYMAPGDEVDERRLPAEAHVKSHNRVNKKFDLQHFLFVPRTVIENSVVVSIHRALWCRRGLDVVEDGKYENQLASTSVSLMPNPRLIM